MRRNQHAGRKRSTGASLNLLSDDDLHDIHLATLEVLEKTGVWVEDEEARRVFAEAGADVDETNGVVRIPPYMVEEAVRSAPQKFVAAGRDPARDFVLEADRVGFTNFGEGVKLVDPYTGELRLPSKKDVADTARVVDYLSDVDVYERAITAEDVAPRERAAPPGRGLDEQHDEARLHGPHERLPARAHRRDGGRGAGRRGEAAPAAARHLRHLPREPPEAHPGLLRDHHGRGQTRSRGEHPLDGHGRRLLTGHPGRDAGHPQRRGPERHHAQPAHQEGVAGRLRQLDDGHGPALRGRLGGLARVRADRRRRRPAGALLPAARAGSPVRRATPKWSMPRVGTRRP